MTNPLTLPSDEAAKVIRRRRSEALKRLVIPDQPWGRAFEAVILFYEKMGDVGMAEMLRLDLDRFARMDEEERKVEWERTKKADDGAA